VRVTHLPTNTVVCIQDERSQHQNKAKALRILGARINDQIRQKVKERSEFVFGVAFKFQKRPPTRNNQRARSVDTFSSFLITDKKNEPQTDQPRASASGGRDDWVGGSLRAHSNLQLPTGKIIRSEDIWRFVCFRLFEKSHRAIAAVVQVWFTLCCIVLLLQIYVKLSLFILVLSNSLDFS
jgi:hypothetical protein